MLSHVLHPWLAEARIAFPRRLGASWPRAAAGAMLATAVCVLVVAAASQAGMSASAIASFSLHAIGQWPLPMLLLFAVAGYALMRGRLLLLLDDWQSGWLAATPSGPHSRLLTSLAITAVGTALATITVAGVLIVVAAIAGSGMDLHIEMTIAATGIALGTALGLLSALRAGRRSSVQACEGVRQPLLSLTALLDRRLPHLFDWQRREALLRWRRGGNFRWLGAVLVALPSGISNRTALAVLLLAASMAWFIVTMRACHHSSRQAQTLCSATPVPHRLFILAAMRYPTFAAACTLGLGAVAVAIGGFPWRALAAWLACIVLLSIRMLPLVLSLPRRWGFAS
jgi:hypothetical protein